VIVCLCQAVSDHTIRAARDAGATTVGSIAAATGAGTGCGCCLGAIARILAEPCRAVPCADCPERAAEAVPLRAAAGKLETP
jgi:bacterioferritin-associated ferredoxin